MKTLLLISHPDIDTSSTQQFFLASLPESEDITVHILDKEYEPGQIDVDREQALLMAHDRIVFQYPLYWYMTPPLMKEWLDVVLLNHFAYGAGGDKLAKKEWGTVVTAGNAEKEHHANGVVGFSMNEILIPMRATALRCGMDFIEPLVVYAFHQYEEEDKWRLLVRYQQYLTMENFTTLKDREKWLIQELGETDLSLLPEGAGPVLEQIIEGMEDRRDEIDELLLHTGRED